MGGFFPLRDRFHDYSYSVALTELVLLSVHRSHSGHFYFTSDNLNCLLVHYISSELSAEFKPIFQRGGQKVGANFVSRNCSCYTNLVNVYFIAVIEVEHSDQTRAFVSELLERTHKPVSIHTENERLQESCS